MRYHVFFVIDLASRRVEISDITDQPTAAWRVQVARNLLDFAGGFLVGTTYLLLGGYLIAPTANANRSDPIMSRQRLGGLLRFYCRDVA